MIKLHYAECKIQRNPKDYILEGIPEVEYNFHFDNQDQVNDFIQEAMKRIANLGKGYYIHIDTTENGELKDVYKIHPEER